MTRAVLLEELRGLLGVDVVDVTSAAENLGGRWVFWLSLSLRAGEPAQQLGVLMAGRHLRNPRLLNAWTRAKGRPAVLPSLSAQDGHRAVVLADLLVEEA